MNHLSNPTENCCLCAVVRGCGRFGVIDEPLIETENFMAVTSIGAFVEGWSMVVPKRHYLSLSDKYSDPEFLGIIVKLKELVEGTFGPAIMFEHGAKEAGSLTGCGVDHGHFHVVPSSSILSRLEEDTSIDWIRYENDAESILSGSQDYLFYSEYCDSNELQGVYSLPSLPRSQYFRRVLADSLGIADSWDYKKYLHINLSLSSHEKLRKAS
jgi:diadenosine tetraphosphate (Ap4A) HIT family hydrolase